MIKNLIKISSVAVFIFFIASVSDVAFAATPACGSTITTDTTLDSDMSCAGTALTIGANNIVLDCAGHRITGNRTEQAINSTDKIGTNIRNCVIQNFTYGIYFKNTTYGTVHNNTILDVLGATTGSLCPDYGANSAGGAVSGIYLSISSNNNITSNTISNITGGVGGAGGYYCAGGTGGIGSGIYLSSSIGNNLSANTISNIGGGRGGAGGPWTVGGPGGTGGIGSGIYFSSSTGNNLSTNNITNISGGLGGAPDARAPAGAAQQGYGIFIDSTSLNNEISTSNTVDSDPLLYFYNKTGITVANYKLNANSNPTNLGKIVLINSSGTIYNNTLANFKGVSGSASGGYYRAGETGGIGSGIYLSSSTGNNLSTNSIINISGGRGGLVGYVGSEGAAGIGSAVYLLTSFNNRIYNNLFNNTNNAGFAGTGQNFWNTTKTAGTNIAGGPFLGGNFWANPSGTGFSQTCADVDKDGICDSAYPLAANNIDNLPLSKAAPAPDADKDGVPDSKDVCPDTPSGSVVDSNGCSQVQVDQDLDGICDPGKSSSLCTGTDNCPTVANADQLNTDSDSLGDACDPDKDNDGIYNEIDRNRGTDADESQIVSNDFSDRPFGGTSFGTIVDRAGWTLSMIDLPTFQGITYGVRLGITGTGSGTARVISCNNSVETQLDASGETADITCGSITVLSVQASPNIVLREPPTGTLGKATKVTLRTGQSAKLGSFVNAGVDNTEPITVEILDETDAVIGSGSLSAGQSLDIEPNGPDGSVVISNTGSAAVLFTLDGQALNLVPGQKITDQCPGVSGNAGDTGCPFADKTLIDFHTVDQFKSGFCGTLPNGKPVPECTNPLSGAVVKVFDRDNAQLVAQYSKRPKKDQFSSLFESDLGKVGMCTTDDRGSCLAGENHPGHFLVIAKFTDQNGTAFYDGKLKNFKNKLIKEASNQDKDDEDIDDVTPDKDTVITKKLHFEQIITNARTLKYPKSQTLKQGESLWALIKSILGDFHNDYIKEIVKKVAKQNGINIPEWGINNGSRDARKLLTGSIIDLAPLDEYLKR